jgi:hypothetical protein
MVEARGIALILAVSRPASMPQPGSRTARRTHLPLFNPDLQKILADIAEQLPHRHERC